MVRGLITAAVVGVVVLGAAGCSSTVSRPDVEKQISDQLAAQVGQTPAGVTCPDDLDAEVGARMRCQLQAEDGSTIGVGIVVTAVEGSGARYDIQVDGAPTP